LAYDVAASARITAMGLASRNHARVCDSLDGCLNFIQSFTDRTGALLA
jgi:hypothetical protein